MLAPSVCRLAGLACLVAAVVAQPTVEKRAAPKLSNAKTSMTLLYQNNLNFTDDANHIGTILLDEMTSLKGAAACSAIGESLLSEAAIKAHLSDFSHSLAYNAFAGRAANTQEYIIEGGVAQVTKKTGCLLYTSPSPRD